MPMLCTCRSRLKFNSSLNANSEPRFQLGKKIPFFAGAMMVWIAALLSAQAQTRPLGIDVSSYQGSADSPPTNIVWTKVKSSGIAFAWAKATVGTGYIDADFVYNESN